MPRSLLELLQDILDRTTRIREYVHQQTRKAFLESPLLQDSVQWNLLVIGEALSQAVKLDSAVVWRISAARDIIALRHLLAHHCYKVSPEVVWGMLDFDLTRLDREMEELHRTLAITEREHE